MKKEREIRKSHVIHALEIDFTFLNRRNELMILVVPTRCATEDIKKSTMHITLSISICKAKNLYTNMSRISIHQSLLMIDKLSMI